MIVGLTGGIGSGKSVVARLFSMLGCAVFNSDEAGRLAYSEPEVRQQVTALLGPGAYLDDGRINRAYISNRIFADLAARSALNSIIHPAVGRHFARFVNANADRIIIKESALLFEAGITAGLDRIIVVTAPEEDRISRVIRRDGLTRDQVLAKLRSQMPEDEKVRQADFVIRNDEKHLIIGQVDRIFTLLSAS